MRDGFAASVFGHVVILAWGLIAFHSPTPLDASSIESIPVDFVSEDATSAPKGVKTAAVAPKPEPEPVEKKVETPPPEPTPPPPPPPQPTPPPPEPTPPPPEPAPPPPPEPAPPPPPEPPKAAQAEPPPPELAPPPPAPTPEPAPPPPQPAPEAPPAPLPPVPQTATIQPKPDTVPLPKPRPHVQQPPTPQVAKKEPDKFDPDQITALLDKEKQPPQPRPPATQPPSQGSQTASIDAKMSANELDALRGRLAQCWSPPIGWTDPAEVRVIVIITLNPDGSLNGDPKVVQAPQGRYAQTAAESAVRAVRRCAPYVLPAEKYDSWKQVRVTFDPTEMGSG